MVFFKSNIFAGQPPFPLLIEASKTGTPFLLPYKMTPEEMTHMTYYQQVPSTLIKRNSFNLKKTQISFLSPSERFLNQRVKPHYRHTPSEGETHGD